MDILINYLNKEREKPSPLTKWYHKNMINVESRRRFRGLQDTQTKDKTTQKDYSDKSA